MQIQEKINEGNQFYELERERQLQYSAKVELEKDIYCLTICMKFNSDHYSPHEIELMYRKCFMVFFLQIGLATFFFYQMYDETLTVKVPKFEQQCVRLMCSFIMHLFIHPELSMALQMMKFLNYTQEQKYLQNRASCFIIALMKMLSALWCEMVLIILITMTDDIADIIKDFVALEFIVNIDDIFAANLHGVDS